MNRMMERLGAPAPLGTRLLVALIVICTLASIAVRYRQAGVWQEREAAYYLADQPMMTTLDSYKWLRYAAEIDAGEFAAGGEDPLMYYPDGFVKPAPRPLLSQIIALFDGVFGGYHQAGFWLIPFLGSLFIIPFALYFTRLGHPLAGLFGSLTGTFSLIYMVRSSVGRVDTDSLNILFPALASLFILIAGEKRENDRMVWLYSGLAGLAMAGFMWWYAHPGFTIIYLGVLAVYLFLSKVSIRNIAIACGVFVLCSSPWWTWLGVNSLWHFVLNYVIPTKTTGAGFPNVMQTISEAKQADALRTFQNVMSVPAIAVLGLAMTGVMLFTFWRQMLPILPLLLLGLFALKSSVRFSMFLGPFIGVGFGYGAGLLGDAAPKRLKEKSWGVPAFRVGAFLLLFAMVAPFTGMTFVPSPSIQPAVYAEIQNLKNIVPEDGAILSWWDYGLAIEDASGRATFHDGMNQNTPKTYFIARSFSGDQAEMYSIASWLDRYGMDGIRRMTDGGASTAEVVESVTGFTGGPENDDIYIVFTPDMIGKYGAMTYIGTWNFDTDSSNPRNYSRLDCRPTSEPSRLVCNGMETDLEAGIMGSRYPLNRAVITRDGQIVSNKKYSFTGGISLVITLRGNTLSGAYALDETTWNSSFNQLYLLGQPDPELFEEVHNNYPFSRVFRVKKPTGPQQGN